MGKGKFRTKIVGSPAEAAAANPIARRHRRHETADAPSARDLTSARCPSVDLCRMVRFRPEEQPPVDRVFSIVESPLVEYATLTSRWEIGGQDGAPPLSDRFIRFLDRTPSPRKERAIAVLAALKAFSELYPMLYALLVEHVEHGKTERDIAAEAGLSHSTIHKMLERARGLILGAVLHEIPIGA